MLSVRSRLLQTSGRFGAAASERAKRFDRALRVAEILEHVAEVAARPLVSGIELQRAPIRVDRLGGLAQLAMQVAEIVVDGSRRRD